jgi:hypothetical protein
VCTARPECATSLSSLLYPIPTLHAGGASSGTLMTRCSCHEIPHSSLPLWLGGAGTMLKLCVQCFDSCAAPGDSTPISGIRPDLEGRVSSRPRSGASFEVRSLHTRPTVVRYRPA